MKACFPLLACIATFTMLLSPAGADEPTNDETQKPDIEIVNGAWEPVKIVANGQDLDQETLDKVRVELTDGKYVATIGDTTQTGRFTLDESKSPKEMDVFVESGPSKGKTILAIYKLDGKDKSTICYGTEDGPRPMGFSAPEGSGHLLIMHERADEK